jgi:hypothetical protein
VYSEKTRRRKYLVRNEEGRQISENLILAEVPTEER